MGASLLALAKSVYYIIVKTSMYIAFQRLSGNGLLQCNHSLL